MATMYTPGGRRSTAPVISPRATLSTAAYADDQVMRDLMSAMTGTPIGATPASPVAAVNIADIFGSGTQIADFGGDGGMTTGGGTATPSSAGQVAGTVGAMGQGLSALGVLSNDPGLAQLGSTFGTAGMVGGAAAQAAQGNIGGAALSLAPAAAQALGIPGVIAGPAMAAMNPTLGPVDVQAALLGSVVSTVAPPLGALSAISGLFGGPTLSSLAKGMITPVETAQASPVNSMDLAVQQANLAAAQTQQDPLDALMAATNAFGTAPATQAPVVDFSSPAFGVSADTGIDGIDASMGVGIDGTTVG